jgi:Ca2+-binding RTX toxin-like protein
MAVSIVVNPVAPGAAFRGILFEIDLMLDAVSITRTPTLFVSTPDPITGLTWRVTGTGLTYTGTELTGGTITGIEYRNGASTLWTVTGLSLNANGLDAASDVSIEGLVPFVAPEFDGDDSLNGGNGRDILEGFGGDDTLIGGNGNDEIYGGRGSDSINAQNGDDLILDDKGRDTLNGWDGHDTINGGGGRDSVFGGIGNDQVFGSTGGDTLTGDVGNDFVAGEEGNDLVEGGLGTDTLNGGAGADRFYFRSTWEADVIEDFVAGTDKIVLFASDTGLTAGKLKATEFHIGAAAQDAADRVIYNPANGLLYFDADGSGAGAAVLLADLIGNPTLTRSDFLIE